MSQYLVYRLTKTKVKDPGWSTPIINATHEFFATYQKAEAYRNKLLKLIAENSAYRGREVIHVSEISEVE